MALQLEFAGKLQNRLHLKFCAAGRNDLVWKILRLQEKKLSQVNAIIPRDQLHLSPLKGKGFSCQLPEVRDQL